MPYFYTYVSSVLGQAFPHSRQQLHLAFRLIPAATTTEGVFGHGQAARSKGTSLPGTTAADPEQHHSSDSCFQGCPCGWCVAQGLCTASARGSGTPKLIFLFFLRPRKGCGDVQRTPLLPGKQLYKMDGFSYPLARDSKCSSATFESPRQTSLFVRASRCQTTTRCFSPRMLPASMTVRPREGGFTCVSADTHTWRNSTESHNQTC